MLIIFAFACVTSPDNTGTRRDVIGYNSKIFLRASLCKLSASFCKLLLFLQHFYYILVQQI